MWNATRIRYNLSRTERKAMWISSDVFLLVYCYDKSALPEDQKKTANQSSVTPPFLRGTEMAY